MSIAKIAIIGSGGVGAVTALALQSSGKSEVTMVVRSDYKTVVESGYQFESCDYGIVKDWRPAHVANSVDAAVEHGPFDYVFVCTKYIPEVQKTEDIIRPLITPGLSIVLLQNGISNEDAPAAAYPDCYVIGGVSMIGSANRGANIKHETSDSVKFGTFDKRPEAAEAVSRLVDIYKHSKSSAEVADDLLYSRWVKLVYNASFNTIAALTGTDTGRLFVAGASGLIKAAMLEVKTIAEKSLSKKLPDDVVDFMLESDGDTYYPPSMLVDVHKGQVLELEAILGNPLRIAHKVGIDAPILKVIYQLLRPVQYRLLEGRGYITCPEHIDRSKDMSYFGKLPWNE